VTVWTGLVTAWRIKSWLRGNCTCLFGVLSVFGRHIKGMLRLRPEQVWTCNVTLHFHTCLARNCTIPLMWRPNTDSTPNKSVTLPRNVTLHVQTCPGRNRTIPLMRQPNTDSTLNKPVTLPRNQLLIRYAVMSPVHTIMIRCYGTR
jgi:hypothetical protein